MDVDEIITVKEIALKYKVTDRTIYSYVRGFYYKDGKKIFYPDRFPRPINKVGKKLKFKAKEIEFFFLNESEEYQKTVTKAKAYVDSTLA